MKKFVNQLYLTYHLPQSVAHLYTIFPAMHYLPIKKNTGNTTARKSTCLDMFVNKYLEITKYPSNCEDYMKLSISLLNEPQTSSGKHCLSIDQTVGNTQPSLFFL